MSWFCRDRASGESERTGSGEGGDGRNVGFGDGLKGDILETCKEERLA